MKETPKKNNKKEVQQGKRKKKMKEAERGAAREPLLLHRATRRCSVTYICKSCTRSTQLMHGDFILVADEGALLCESLTAARRPLVQPLRCC